MVSLVYWFINLFPRKIIQVRRMPPHTVIRAHLAGLTLAMILVLFTQGLNISSLDFFPVILFTAIFALGTYIGGPFVILVTLFSFGTAGTLGPGFLSSLYHLTDWYFIGYIFGGIFATLYNDLVFLYMITYRRRSIKIAFAYDRTQEFNIIKSPEEREEEALLNLLKPVVFYLKNIENASENSRVREENANEVAALIRTAFEKMTDAEQDDLLHILCKITGISGGGLDEKLDELVRKLKTEDDRDTLRELTRKVEKRIQPLIELHLNLKERKLYDYELDEAPEKPYTIAFVANPHILKRRDPRIEYDRHRKNKNNYIKDPILKNRDLFMRSVDRALFTFERDEVVGRAEIWSRVRVLTIFDEKLADASGVNYGLVEEFQDNVRINNRVIENLIDPMAQMIVNDQNRNDEGNFFRMFREYQEGLPDDEKIPIDEIDVIYAMTAAPDHDRSTAHYAGWLETENGGPDRSKTRGCTFNYDPDPNHDPELDPVHGYPKNNDISVHRCTLNEDADYICIHEDVAEHPGRIALNVIGARQKTFIHEFAHAMSSAYRGAIVDEYFDRSIIRKSGEDNASDDEKKEPFYANRIARSDNGKIIPVHRIFARYNGETYRSDKDHPSAEEEWSGYFPERSEAGVGCTMDRTIGRYRFDKLLSTFMYERLLSKLNRPNPEQLTRSKKK